jgi:2-iminobutanoate/2-iminopropanoate deaminase
MLSNFKLVVLLASTFLVSACSSVPTIERKHYYSWENDYGYSQVVKAGNTIYISGIASDAIVKQVVYTTDIKAMKAHTELRKTFFNKDKYPSSSIVQVSRLYEKGHFLEVEIVAVIPKS